MTNEVATKEQWNSIMEMDSDQNPPDPCPDPLPNSASGQRYRPTLALAAAALRNLQSHKLARMLSPGTRSRIALEAN